MTQNLTKEQEVAQLLEIPFFIIPDSQRVQAIVSRFHVEKENVKKDFVRTLVEITAKDNEITSIQFLFDDIEWITYEPSDYDTDLNAFAKEDWLIEIMAILPYTTLVSYLIQQVPVTEIDSIRDWIEADCPEDKKNPQVNRALCDAIAYAVQQEKQLKAADQCIEDMTTALEKASAKMSKTCNEIKKKYE